MLRSTLFAACILAALVFLPAFCAAQTVSIVSGNGQVVCVACFGPPQAFVPLDVLVTDSNGNPLAGQTVTWVATPGFGSSFGTGPTTATSTTDDTGQAIFDLPVVFPAVGYSYFQTPVTATVGTSSVTFTETTSAPAQNSLGPTIFVSLVSPAITTPYSGMLGTSGSPPVKVTISGIDAGVPGVLQGVAVQIVSMSTTSPGPTLNCMSQPGQQPNTAFTDSTGTAICTPVFGGTPGSGTYQIVVGGTYIFLAGPLTVTPGPPAMIKLISGNGQSVNPSTPFPLPLVAEVDDMAGSPYIGANVTWAVTQGTATLSSTVNTSGSNGQVSTRVTAGANTGPVQVTVSVVGNSSIKYVFTLNINTPYNQLDIVSGNTTPPQSAAENTSFPDPLTVQVNEQATSQSTATPVAGVTVNFAVTSGSATLSAASATTNAQGQAQVTVTAGATPGPVTVTASVGGGVPPVAFSLVVLHPGPIVTAQGFVNAAGFQPQFISPCSLATIYGMGIAPAIQGAVTPFIEPPLLLAGVSVSFGGIPAPILGVVNENGSQSVSVQVPCGVTPGSVPATVTVNGASTTVMVNVMLVSPGIFETVMSDGKSRAVMVRPDGSFVQLENPARRGETIRAYLTGLGQTTPAISTNEFIPLVPDSSGTLVPETLSVAAKTVVGVNNHGVLELSANYAFGLVGVYEVQFVVPTDTATGNDVVFAVAIFQPDGTALFGNSTFMPIQ